jgi:NAD(P)-dependent dehydrogenase (short-subunit alcohol dehydrogenase family)
MKKNWTLTDMPNLKGKVVIITGANSGLGLASAKALAQKGAAVILACRSEERGAAALKEVEAVQATSARLMLLDLGSLESVQAFAENFKAKYDQLDVLMNNAGIMATPYGTTQDGFEKQIGVNHLGHFALTGHLLPVLLGTSGSASSMSPVWRPVMVRWISLLSRTPTTISPGKPTGKASSPT